VGGEQLLLARSHASAGRRHKTNFGGSKGAQLVGLHPFQGKKVLVEDCVANALRHHLGL
jgi:hypothetical protein